MISSSAICEELVWFFCCFFLLRRVGVGGSSLRRKDVVRIPTETCLYVCNPVGFLQFPNTMFWMDE